MGKPLSADIRERVLAAYERGEGTQAALAKRFGIGEASVRRWVRLKRETGSLEPRVAERYGPPPKIEMASMPVLEELLAEHPDATNQEFADMMAERTGIGVSASTISRAIAVLGWTRKKSASSPAKPMPRVSAIFVNVGLPGRRP